MTSMTASPAPAPARAAAAQPIEKAWESEIAAAREGIDALDAQIVALIRERQRLSEHIQRTRLEAGRPRVEISREYVIVNSYVDALGSPGRDLALDLLALCRGPLGGRR